jgi:D-3-phosphoglycerate dehydrogenase
MDVEALGRRGVLVCNCRGQNAVSVAELTFALMLSLMRGVCRADPWIRAGLWAEAGRSLPEWATGHELWGKTLGVIGLGQIGARVARIAKGFEMPVLGYDPFMDPSQYERLGVVPAGLAGLLAGSHVVSLHVPLTPDTANMLNSGSLKAARPGMFLVNTSRGRVIEEEALVEALRDGRLAGAALDVFSTEPLGPEHPLVRMDNVILSPHIGALSREAGDRLSDSVFRQARDILEGRSPEGLIG